MTPMKRMRPQLRTWHAGKTKMCFRKKVFSSVNWQRHRGEKHWLWNHTRTHTQCTDHTHTPNYISICLFIHYPSFHSSIHMATYLTIPLSTSQSICHPSNNPSIYLTIHSSLSSYLTVCPYTSVLVYPSLHLSTHPFIWISLYLFTHPSTSNHPSMNIYPYNLSIYPTYNNKTSHFLR